LRLRNGASRYGKAHSTLYTSSGILHSEDRLMTAAQRTVIPPQRRKTFDAALPWAIRTRTLTRVS
jgi:hypothetical protein